MPCISLRYTAEWSVYVSDALADCRGLDTRKKAFGECILGYNGVCGVFVHSTGGALISLLNIGIKI